MNINDVVLYCIIIGGGGMAFLAYKAHQAQKKLAHSLNGIKERLGKLNKLVLDVENIENQMHLAAVEKVDKRNLDLIIKETLSFIREKGR
ncbi:MAG: hypothetical protein AABY04_04810 [Candidatus Micrarchaeota archaeon]